MEPHSISIISMLAVLAHIAIVLLVAIRVIMRRSAVGVSLAWLTLITLIPVAGAILYGLIGELTLGRRRAFRAQQLLDVYQRWLQRLPAIYESYQLNLMEQQQPLHDLAQSVIGIPAMPFNGIKLFDDTHQSILAIAVDIAAAESHCHLEFYIWHTGGDTALVRDALIAAAARGVICRILVDAVGSEAFLKSDDCQLMRFAGVEIRSALPVNPLRMIFRRLDLRLHRKLVVIDDRLAWTGSLNMIDPRFFKITSNVGQWVDAMVRLQGPVVLVLDSMFVWDWEQETGQGLEILPLPTLNMPKKANTQGATIQVVPSGPGYRKSTIKQLLLSAIYGAHHELVMTTPYFVPDQSLQEALIVAAHRGVRVVIIVPARVDSVLVRNASNAYFDELLQAGVKIYRYREGLLHTKSITVDGHTALFGTVNLDMRSLWLNFEVTLCVYDKTFGQSLRALQQIYQNASTPLNDEAWKKRGLIRRFCENTAYLLGPLL